ncbi:MAG: UDP-N-acetylmuramoyl-L-alanyl-D-glutamate--2,6-diaminopimelate ligase [Desulfobacteraceae bacterium]|nr:UDP-N-acetylmuramoyl-L-alanyl-D-glutamate--2,6-diaminopimelate ligase [Desulfobacteraceae bacterium]
MKLSALIAGVPIKAVIDDGSESLVLRNDIDIGSVHYRAQDVQPGSVFVAIKGFAADGHDYIETAVQQGAAAIISEKKQVKAPVVVLVENSRKALASVSARFLGSPSDSLFMVGITGTNGKTTITYLMESILNEAGWHTGIIGTINYRYAGKAFNNPVTTPESLDLQKILGTMRDNGVSHVVMEVSSHALDLHRIHDCKIDMGVFTNLTQDHLDYHQDMDSYWACKKKLFTDHIAPASEKARVQAVINCRDPRGKSLGGEISYPYFCTGREKDADIRATSFQIDQHGIKAVIDTPAGPIDIDSGLVGDYNLDNILCAVGAATAMQVPPETIKAGIDKMAVTPGRLESVKNTVDRFIYVDYAHTPDALDNVLRTLKQVSPGRLICVFGCGGDRDKKKRPLMGNIAARYSDLAVITSDNPRTEDPDQVIADILPGMTDTALTPYAHDSLTEGFDRKGFVAVVDRKSAIFLAIRVSQPGDTILIAGKGHETYQVLGHKTIDFDDRQAAKAAIESELKP